MKAVVYSGYGETEVLALEDFERPVPGDDEVLIKVRAASVNPLDYHIMHGEPFVTRLMFGRRKPKFRPGRDVAGEVEAVGRNVTALKPGDAVFGICNGAFAEYACAEQSKFVKKPENVTFEEAAAVPIAGFTALQGLGKLNPGQKVLINGAAGGVGTFAVQIAKAADAEVTGVCSTRNVDLVKSIGADRVIDYTRNDFTDGAERYDLILDCYATHSFSALERALTPRGVCILIGGPISSTFAIFATLLKTLFNRHVRSFLAKVRRDDLVAISNLMAAGSVKPVIDRTYPLSAIREAVAYLEEGHARGKVIIVP